MLRKLAADGGGEGAKVGDRIDEMSKHELHRTSWPNPSHESSGV
jgi:hypothetical protein